MATASNMMRHYSHVCRADGADNLGKVLYYLWLGLATGLCAAVTHNVGEKMFMQQTILGIPFNKGSTRETRYCVATWARLMPSSELFLYRAVRARQ